MSYRTKRTEFLSHHILKAIFDKAHLLRQKCAKNIFLRGLISLDLGHLFAAIIRGLMAKLILQSGKLLECSKLIQFHGTLNALKTDSVLFFIHFLTLMHIAPL